MTMNIPGIRGLWINLQAAVAGTAGAVLLVAAVATGVQAESVDSREAEMIRSLGDDVLSTLTQMKSRQDPGVTAVRDRIQQSFDLPRLARFSLGRYWQSIDPAMQSEFEQLFSDYLEAINLQRLWRYRESVFSVIGEAKTASGDVLVTSLIKPAAMKTAQLQGAQIVWRVRKSDGGLKVVDVMHQGVSMAMTMRQEFVSIVRRDSIDGLMSRLRQRIENGVWRQDTVTRVDHCVPCVLFTQLKSI